MANAGTPQAIVGALPVAPAMGHSALVARVRAWPWQGVAWTIGFIAFLYYIAVVTTYHLPGATWAMVIALLAIPFQKGGVRFPPMMVYFAGFWFVGAIGYASTEFKPEVYTALIELGKLWLITLAGVNVLRTRTQLRAFIVFFLACFALYPLRGTYYNVLYGITHAGRYAWNFIYSNPNDLSAIAMLPLCLCAGLLYVEQNRILRWAAKIGIALITVMTFFTMSRGAFLALAVTAIIAILGMKKRVKYLGILAGLGVIISLAAPESTWVRFKGLRHLGTSQEELAQVDPEGSALQRYDIWKTARRIIAQHPVLGVGIGAYRYEHQREALRGTTPSIALGQRDTHSTYLNVLAEGGVIGAVFFFSIFLSALWYSRRVRRRLRPVNPGAERQIFLLELGLLAFALTAIFGTYVILAFTYLYAILLFSLSRVAEDEVRAMSGFVYRR